VNQQIKFFKEHPETLIPGYKESERDYKETQQALSEIDKLTENEKTVFNMAVNGFDLSKYVRLAKIYTKKFLRKN